MKWQNIVIIILSVLVIGLIGGVCWLSHSTPEPEVIERVDTMIITKTDTVKIHKTEIKERIKEIKVLDTITIHDTILMRVQRRYDDSIAHIIYSGIDPEIDSITYTLPVKEVVIEKEKEIHVVDKKKVGWSITVGPQLGVGLTSDIPNNGKVSVGPYVGIGVNVGWGVLIK